MIPEPTGPSLPHSLGYIGIFDDSKLSGLGGLFPSSEILMSGTTLSASLSLNSCISRNHDHNSIFTEKTFLTPENFTTDGDGLIGATSWLVGDVTTGGDGLVGTKSWLGAPEQVNSLTQNGTGSTGDRSIVFVDGAIADVSSLLIGLAPGTEVVRLDAAQDGVEQIGEVLSQRQNVSGIHILSHGNQGLLQLGTATLSADNLAQYQSTLEGWGSHLSNNADILLYGCDVAEGAIGQTFVQDLANLTGADVAASVDLTGNASLGGDWDLEYHQGAIDTASLAAPSFDSVLAATVSFDNGALVYESTDSTDNQIKIYTSDSYLTIEDSTGLTAGSNVTVVNNQVQVQTSSISSLQIKAGSGNDSIKITNGISLNSSVSIDGEDGDDSFNVSNELNFYTQGNDLTVAAETIELGDKATVSTRQVSENHLTGNSTGNSGNISFTGETITLGSNSALLSQVQTGSNYTAGSIDLIVSDTGNSKTATTGIYLNESSILKGGDITLQSESDSSNIYDGFNDDETALENLEEVVDGFFNTTVGFVDSTSPILGVARANSNATINIGQKTTIDASNLTINATSDTKATVDAFSLQLGVALAYGESNPTANINIDNDANITATGNIDIDTNANSTLNIQAAANSLGTFAGNSKYFFGIAGTNSTVKSTVNLASNATLNAGGNVTIDANTDKDHSSAVSILGISKEGGYGLGINLSFADVTAQALVDGKITAAKAVEINADADTKNNKVSAGINVGEPDGFALSLMVAGIENLQKLAGQSSEQTNQSQRGATGSFVYANHDNTAVARIGDGATVKSGEKLDVTAKVTENPEFSSSSKSKVKVKGSNADAKAASVAILLGDINNTAKAYIGDNAIADAKGAMKVESNVDMPFDDDFTTAFTTLNDPTAGEITNLIFSHLKKDAGVSVLFTSWAKAKAYGNNVSFGGSVNYLNIDNISDAYIGENAQINQDLSYRSTGNQTVAVNAYGNSFTLNFSGDFNPLTELTTLIKNSFGIKNQVYDMLFGSGKVADKGVGIGYVQLGSGNTIKATIKDGASIYTDKLDVLANLTTTNISIGATGSFASVAKKSAVNASFSLNDGNDTVLANVSNLAKIVSKGEINVNANNNVNNYSFAGGFASGQNQGIGIGVGFNNWERTTEAAIGNTSESLGFNANNDVDIDNDKITIKDHGLKTGDIILYSNESGTSIGNLTHDKLYFVIVVDENTIELADSRSNALAGTKRNLTSKGTGNQELITLDELQSNSLSKTIFDPADGVEDYNYIDPDGETVVVGYLDPTQISNNTITLKNHGLSSGDLITYYNDANDLSDLTEAEGETIQVKNLGVLAQGTTYKVINVSGDTFQLAAANDNTNTPLDVSYTKVDDRINKHYFKRSVIDLDKDIIVDNAHGFATGDRVVYSNGGGTSIGVNNTDGKLVDEQNYYIIKVDDNRVKLAKTYNDAISGTAIDLTSTGSGDVHTLRAATVNIDNDEINLIGHGYKTGDAVIYDNNGGTSIGASNAAKQLVDEGTYYIIKIDDNTVKLADSYNNAVNKVAIDLTSTGSGSDHSFSLVNFLDLSADTITLKNHDLQTGDAIVYSNGGGTSISTSNGELTDGEVYYAIVVDENTIKLATSSNNATNKIAIDLTGAGSGTSHQFFQKPTINLSAGSISAEGSITVSSENTGYNIAGAIAGSYSSGSSYFDGGISFNKRDYSSLTNSSGSGGFAFSGDSAINLISDTTKAYIKDATVTAGERQVTITATSDTKIKTIGGAVAIANAKDEDSGSSYGIAGSFGYNDVDATTTAFIDRSTLNIGSANISATNSNYILSVVASGSGAFNDKGRAFAGSVTDNNITNTTLAYIGNYSNINASGNLNLNPLDSSSILSVAGALDYGGQYGIGASIAVNFTNNTTKAYLQNSDVSAASLSLTAENDNDIESIAGAAGASLNGMAAEFSFTYNDTENTADAYIEDTASDDGIDISGDIALNANDSSTILSIAGIFSLAFVSSSDDSNSAKTLGASVALNKINNTNQTYIDSASVKGTGNLTLKTDSFAEIKAYSFGGTVSAASLSGSGWSVSGAGAATHNEITNTINAYISNSNSDTKSISIANGAITIEAIDNTTIHGDAGGFAIALASVSNSGTATTGSVGAGIAVNQVTNKTHAYVDNAKLTSRSAKTSAQSTATIKALAIGGSISGSHSSTGGAALSFSGAGSGTYNEINNEIEAYLYNGSSVTTTAGALTVSALDDSDITANSAGVAVALALTGNSFGTGGSVSVGAAIANNDIENTTTAYIDNASAQVAGNLSVTASSTSTIDAFAIGAAVAGSYTSQGLGVTLTGSGAGSSNWIDNSITAYISNVSSTKPVSTSNGGSITISATDASDITADAGGYSVGLSLGSSALSGNLSIGVSIANNDIGNTVQAYIDNANVSAAGAITIEATATDTIDALGIGGSASGSVGSSSGAALNLSGAGAGVTNSIDNTITATIQNSSNVSTSNSSDISLTATDNSKITSDAGGIAIALAFGSSSLNGSVGASVGTNKIGKEEGHFIKAYIDNSTVTADGNLNISATSTATIDALAFSGSAAGSGGSGAGLNFTGTAAISKNDIKATIQAEITNVSGAFNPITNTTKSVTTKNGSIKLTALDSSHITSDAGGMAIALGVSSGVSAGLSVGFSIADNTIANTTQALIDRASVNAKTTLDLGAKFNGWIDTFALGGAFTVAAGSKGGAAFSGAGAGSYNTITNTIEAAIINNSDVDAGSTLTLKAEDATTDSNGNQIKANQVRALAVGASVSASAGSSGAGSLAISAVVVDNTLTNKVRAYIGADSVTTDTTTVDAPNLVLTSTSTPTLESTAAAVAVAASLSRNGIALSGGGANITNTLNNTIATLIQGGSTATASTGAIKLTTSDTPTITSSVGSGAGVLAPLGGSLAVSLTDITVNDTVTAAIQNATVNAKSGDITLDVDSTPTLTSTAAATSIAIALGGSAAGAEADATVSSTVSAYIGDNATINTKTLNVWADSNDSATTTAYGISASSIAAIGASVATSKVNGSTKAYAGSNDASVTGTTINATGVDIAAKGTGKAKTTVTAISAGIGVAGAGNDGEAIFIPTIEAFIGDSTTLNIGTGNVSVKATAQPQADADALGVSVAGTVEMGYSEALAKVAPTVNAFVGKNSKITASNLTVLAQQILPTSGYTANSDASGSGGALWGSVNATVSTAKNQGQVSAYIGNNSTLTITNAALIKADADSTQDAYADGYNAGIFAGGANLSFAETNITTQTYIGSAVTINAGSLAIDASGGSNNFADSQAGGGGIVSGRAAQSETTNTSTSKVYLNYDPTLADNSNNSTTTINAKSVSITGEQTTTFNSRADAINASIVGGSGAAAYNTVDSTVNVNLGSHVNLTTQDLEVNSNNTIDKSTLNDQNAEAGSGGIVDGSAVVVETIINNETTIIVGDNTDLTVNGSSVNPGDFKLTATNNISADEDAKIETGGIVPVAGADTTIKNNKNIAQIQIGAAELSSVGDIELSTIINADINAYAKAKVWGLAGGPIGSSLVEFTGTNQIDLLSGAKISAGRDANLRAGQLSDGTWNHIDLNADTYLFNGTAATGVTPEADASLTLNNKITVGSNSQIESVRNTNLDAVKGTTSVDAEGIGQSSLGTAVEAISNAFGADVSTKISSNSTPVENIISGVQIDGTITAGTKNQASLTINSDGIGRNNIDAPTLVSLDLGSEILSQISSLDTQIASTNDQSVITALTEQKTALQAMLQSFGAAANGYATFLSIPDVYVSSGNIQVAGDYVIGNGALEAKADTSINITNDSSYNLLLNNLIIDDNSGGKVLFNDGSIANNSNINVRNLNTNNTANFSSIVTNDSATSQLTVSSTNTAAPIMLVASNGSLENLNGTLSLSNTYGSIGVLGNIEAKTIDINAGKNFFLNSSGMYNTGGNPEAIFANLINYTEGLQTPTFTPYASEQLTGTAPNYGTVFVRGGNSDSQNAAVNTALQTSTQDETLYNQGLATQSSQIIASNNIVINASQLNINGLVQSGISDYNLTLDSSLNSIINSFSTAYSTNSSKPSNLYSYNGHLYFLSNADSWEAAQAQAELWGGDLATINNAAEQSWLMNTFGGSQNLWIGYTDRLSEGTFAWMSGETSTYTNWGTGEPNNYGGVEDYAYLRTDGKWNDDSNNQSYRGIIEISSSALPNAATSKLNLTPYLSSSNNVTTYYNAQTNQIEVDDVKVQGGYVYLSGEIMSTGNGKIKAMDGYGKINIQNQTNYQLQLNQLDTGGEGVDGKVVIVDKKKGTTTTFTNNGSRTATYTPGDLSYVYRDYRNVYKLYMDLELQETLDKWSDFTLLGQRVNDNNYSFTGSNAQLTSNGVANANFAVVLSGERSSVLSSQYSPDSTTFQYNGSTYIYTDPYGRIQQTFEAEERFLYYFRGNYNIGIEFIGYDSGTINVSSGKDILVNGSITNNTGTTTLTSTSGAIQRSDSAAEIISKDVVLSANTGIGTSDSALKTDLQAGSLAATTASGDLNISETDGDLTFTNITATSGNVTLTAEHDLLGANSTSSITGRQVSLTASTGNVGSTNSLLAIDSGTDAVNGGLSVSAAGDINLNETTGDLYLISATSKGGDVTIKVANGKILDYNSTEEEDTAAKQAILQAVWEDLRLTADYGAQDSIDAAITAYERAQEYLYKIYWQGLNVTQNADGSYTADAYDSNATYTLTDSETAHLAAYGYTNYQALHTALASQGLTTSYNSNYSYTASGSEISKLSQGGVWSEAALNNTFSAGLFLPVSDTETTIEADNITAQDLNLTAQGIGKQSGTTTLDLAAIKAQGGATEAQLLAFLTAERNDITYYDLNGAEITTTVSDLSNVSKIVITSVEDVDVTATGKLTVTSTGDVFLGSESDLLINQVKASGYEVRIKTGAGIYNNDNTGTVTNITANSAILEAGDSSLGTSAAPLLTQLGDAAVYNNKLYLLTDNLTWEQAEAKAQSLGGHLVTINDANENKWLQQTFGTSEQYWIGLTDKVTEGQFKWINGEAVSYTDWASGEPNNYNGDQDYAVINYTSNKKWDDTNGALTYKGIIELDLHEYNGHLYLLSGSQTWESAETIAESVGGNLVTINNAAEEQWLQQTFGTSEQYWIGLTDKVTEGQFKWISGEDVSYTNWGSGEPNNYENNQDYAVINYTSSKKWDDTSGALSYKGIIELDNYVGTLTARANDNIYIHQVNQNPLYVDEAYAGGAINITSAKDMSIGQIYGVSSVTLNSGGTITDLYGDTANNIESKAIALSSGGDIGTASDEVEIYLDSVGSLTLNTSHNVYVHNLSTDDVLNVNFSGHVGTLTNSTIVDTTSGSAIGYSSFNTVNVNLGSGTNTFTVASLAATTTTNLYSTSGTDTFQIGSSNLVNASQVAGSIGIHGGTGTTTLLLNNSADTTANTVTVTDTTVNAFGLKPIAYTDVDAIALYTGSAQDTITVNSLQANTTLTLGGSGGVDTLTINDSSNINRTIKVADTKVTGLWNSTINYSSIENLNLNTNNATNTVGVESLGSSTNLNLVGGTGTNTFNLGYYQTVEFIRFKVNGYAYDQVIDIDTGSLDQITGKVNVYGGTGQTTLIVNDGADLTTAPVTASSSEASVTLKGIAAGQDVTVTDSSLLGLATQGIYYQNVDQLNIVTTGLVRTNTTPRFKIDSIGTGTTLNVDSVFNAENTINRYFGYVSQPNAVIDARTYSFGSTTNLLNNILGTANIVSNSATLNVSDTANSTGNTYTVSSGALTGFNSTGKIGVNENTLNLYTGSGNDQFDLSFSKQIQVYSGAGDDTFIMRSLTGGGTINGGVGNDSYRFGVGTTLDTVNVNANVVDEGGTSDRFIFDDTAYTGSRIITVNSNGITSNQSSLLGNYSGIENIQLDMGSGNDYLEVSSLAATTNLEAKMNGGNDTLIVGYNSQGTTTIGSHSRTVLGTISIDGGSGTNEIDISDVDYFNANRAQTNDTIRVKNNSISGLTSNPVNYSNFQNVIVGSGDGADTLIVESLAADQSLEFWDLNFISLTKTIIDIGDPQAQTIANILGQFKRIYTSGNNDELIINAAADTVDRTIAVNQGNIQGVAIDGLQFYDTIENIVINTGTGKDAISINSLSSVTQSLTLNTGAGADTVNVTGLGGTPALTINTQEGNDQVTLAELSGVTQLALNTGSGNDTVTLSATNGSTNAAIDTGDDNDRIQLANLSPFSQLTVKAGAGDDTIEATAATGTTGLVVINAEAGNDSVDASLLTTGLVINGDDGDDTIQGSKGNDLIGGGAGSDTIYGNQGSDEIYGDSTFPTTASDAKYTGFTFPSTIELFTNSRPAPTSAVTSGDDKLYGGDGEDVIYGEGGNDAIATGNGSKEVVFAGAGDDAIDARNSDGSNDSYKLIDGGTGTNTLQQNFSNALLNPEIEVTDSNNTALSSGATSDFGLIAIDSTVGTTTTSQKTYTIRNTGTKTLSFTGASISGTNASNFAIVGDIPTVLAPGTSSTITVQFDPSAIGYQKATLTLLNNDSDESTYTIALLGEGLVSGKGLYLSRSDKTRIDANSGQHYVYFDSTAVGGSSSTQTIELANYGTTPLNIDWYEIVASSRGNEFFFVQAPTAVTTGSTYSSGSGFTLNMGEKVTFIIRCTPTTTGTPFSNFLISESGNMFSGLANLQGTAITRTISLKQGSTAIGEFDTQSFGSVNAESGLTTQTFTLTNVTSSSLTLTQPTIGGTAASDFTLNTSTLPTQLAAGASASFTVTFDPSIVGDRTASLSLYNYALSLTGKGISASDSQAQMVGLTDGTTTATANNFLKFENVEVGQAAATKTLTLTNTSSSAWDLAQIYIYGLNQNFTLVGNVPKGTLASGASTTFTVQYAPLNSGEHTATLTLYSKQFSDNPFTYNLYGFSPYIPAIAIDNAVSTLSESTDTSNRIKVADLNITYGGSNPYTVSLSGVDKDKFEVINKELYLKAGTVLDYETQKSLQVTVAIDEPTVGTTPDSSQNLVIAIADSNEAPTLALQTTVTSLAENADTSNRIKVADITITDDALGTNTLSLSGADANLFEIINNAVYLKAGTTLDYETKSSLQVTVALDDNTVGATPDSTQNLVVAIANVNEAPTVTLQNTVTSLAENTNTSNRVKVADITIADDALGTNTLSLTGTDADKFEILGTELFIKAGTVLDYETKTSLNVTVAVDDNTVGTTPDSTQNLVIAIANVNEAPTVTLQNQVVSLAEDTNTSNRVKVADITIADDALGTNTLSLTGTDADKFEIVGTELFIKAGTVLDYETQTSLDVAVAVDDSSVGTTPDAVATLKLAITDVMEFPEINIKQGTVDLATGATYNFGSFNVTSGITQTSFTIENTGKASLNIANIQISGLNAGDFTLVSSIPTGTLAIGATATFTVRFDPSAAGTRTATLTIGNNDADEGSYSITLTGTGNTTSTFTGTTSDDTIYSNGGDNTINAGAGNDVFNGGSGAELVYAGDGNDLLYGGAGSDRLYGENGQDTLYGGTGNDQLQGGNDDDQLYGDEGNDIMLGDAGNDYLDGGTGSDQMRGGTGSDTFVLRLDSANFDTILDFNVNEDNFKLMGLALTQLSFADSGSYGLIMVGSTVIAKIYNVNAAQLQTYFNSRYQP